MTKEPTTKHEEKWNVGQENPRESERFRWPVYVTTADPSASNSWPWLGLFETKAAAERAVGRVNEYPHLVEESFQMRKRIAELEQALGLAARATTGASA